MSVIRLNDLRAASLTLTLPRYGRGQADVYLPRLDGPVQGEKVTLELNEATFDMTVCLAGRVTKFSEGNGAGYSVRAVQGENALHTPLAKRYYENFTKERVLLDGVRDAGEVAGEVMVEGFLAKFARLEAPLVALLRDLDVRWWFDASGRLCAGERVGAEVAVRSMGFFRDGLMTRLNPAIEPGMVLGDQTLARVVHRVSPKGQVSELYV